MFDQWLDTHQETILKALIAWRRSQNDTRPDEFIRTGAEIGLKLLGQALRGEVNWEQASRTATEQGLVRGITVHILTESSYGIYKAISRVLRDERPEHWCEWLDTLGDHMLIASQIVSEVLEAKLEERVLQRTQEVILFKTMAENSTDAIVMIDTETRCFTYANRAAYEMFGYDYDRQEMIGLAGTNNWLEEDVPFLMETITPQIIAGGWKGEVQQKRKDGSVFEANIVIFPLHDDSGKVINMVVTIHDITERKQAEKELAETKALMEAVVDQSPVPIVVIGAPDMVLRMENPAARKHLGIEDEKSKVGCSLSEIKATWQIFDANGNPVGHTESPLAKAARGVEIRGTEYMIKRKDGTTRWNMLDSVPIYNKDGQRIAGMIIFPDITDHKLAEQALRESEMNFRSFAEASSYGFGIGDLTGHMTFLNQTMLNILDQESLETAHAKASSEYYTPADLERLQNEVLPAIMQKGQWVGEIPMISAKGKVTPTEQNLFLIYDEQGQPRLLGNIVTDITERKRAEAEREQLQQEIIEAQRRAIAELSTPVIPIMDRIIVMPLIGSIDSLRARDITRSLLAGISQHRAKVVILDVTGVGIMDSGVVNHLNKTIQAARLKGAQTILTGLSDTVAEAVVDLGIDWGGLTTLSDLQTGLLAALERLGIKLAR